MSEVMNSHIRELQRLLAEARRERDELREALRPFADGHRIITSRLSVPHGLGYHNTFTMADLARAAELVPGWGATSSPPPSPAAPHAT